MDIILLERIPRLGHMGETVKVRDGYARNFLLPTGRALRANAANQARFEAERAILEQRNEERRQDAQAIADTLNGKSFVAVRAAGETGQLYGSVSTRDIADLLAENGYRIARNDIRMDQPIKRIGVHALEISLHPEVTVTVRINVARSNDEAERQARGEDLTDPDTLFGADDDEDDLEPEVLDEDESQALAAEQADSVEAPVDPAEQRQPDV